MVVFFDLDGTLLDSLEDIARCCNLALMDEGLEPLSVREYRYLVGEGALVLAQKISPDKEMCARVYEGFKRYYKDGWMEHTKPYGGALQMLQTLQSNGVKLGILSNKPEPFVKLCATHFFPKIEFFAVLGEVDGYAKKPDITRLNEILKSVHVELDFFVGDTKVDMKTAKNLGVEALGVSWGFRDEAELRANGADEVFNSVEELSEFLQSRI